ncbi:penicillin acylase family protein [Catellatospora bangladeshensis]|uniref:Penicillin amidase n=1 Tax=Catellatospora bangladeshensis TaxID=310355 RepID=A0A8J3JIR0_9ACTN|nr:penicillin acylase family protein [Catellatospora bangladeshensis]GIF78889.1 penicillin amidase [Catellatospora bangladeshensis]
MKPPRLLLRRLRTTALWLLGVVTVLAVVVAGLGVWSVRRAFATVDGELTLAGLSAPVTVRRDVYGIPQLYARTSDDLYRAQGYVHAQDRFWEMDFRRHVTAGRVSELFGQSQVETDKYLRTMGWRRVAEQELALLKPESQQALRAYADGVNAWLAANTDTASLPSGQGDGFASSGALSLEYSLLGLQNSGYVIERWTPVDSLAWLKAMAWDLRGNMEAEIRRAALQAEGLSKEQVDQLYPAYPLDRNLPIVNGGVIVNGAFDAKATAPAPAPAVTPPAPAPLSATGLRDLADGLAELPGLMGNADGDGIGSNSWVISGKLTATGKPILANDPHLSPSQPGIWYQIGLHCECGVEVAGFSFSGVPGVVIGHNAKIAWGFTNLDPDVIDMYLEEVDGDKVKAGDGWEQLTSRQEVIKVAGGSDVTITVRTGRHGPLLSDASESLAKLGGRYAIAMRWTALDPGRTADALFALNKAGNWTEFRAAAAQFEVPAQNIVYADVEGNIGYQSPGRIPVRGAGDGKRFAPGWDKAYDWTGFIPFDELPSVLNPDRGYVVTANQAVIGDQYQRHLTDDWSYGYRSQRIYDMIGTAGGKITVEDVQKQQFDNRNGFAPTLIPALQKAPRPALSQVEKNADALLVDWDYQQGEDSAAAAYYNAIWKNLLGLTFDELGADYAADGGDRWFEVVRGLLNKPDDKWWDAKGTPAVEQRDDMLAQAMSAAVKELAEAQGEDPKQWRWGAMHTLTPTHATFGESGIGPIEWLFNRDTVGVSGGDAIVNATGWSAGEGYEVDAVPSMRMIVNLADLNESRWVQLTGNSGHAFHENYADQFELWRTGRTLPFRFDKAAIEAEAKATLTLKP